MPQRKVKLNQIDPIGISNVVNLQAALDALGANIIVEVNSPNIAVNMWVYGKKAGINNGDEFLGVVLTAPPTEDDHIRFVSRITTR